MKMLTLSVPVDVWDRTVHEFSEQGRLEWDHNVRTKSRSLHSTTRWVLDGKWQVKELLDSQHGTYDITLPKEAAECLSVL